MNRHKTQIITKKVVSNYLLYDFLAPVSVRFTAFLRVNLPTNWWHFISVGAVRKVQRKVGVFPETRLWIRTTLGCDVLHARLRTSRRRDLRPERATWTWYVPRGSALHQKQWSTRQFGCLWIAYSGKNTKNHRFHKQKPRWFRFLICNF